MNLQCRKFGEVEDNQPSANCTVKRFWDKWQFLTIPEVYVCKPHQFNFKTFFNITREESLRGGVCQGIGDNVKCFIPKAIQKTFLNLVLFALTSFGLVFASLELVLTIFKQIYRAYKVLYKKELQDKSRNQPDLEITHPMEFHEFKTGRLMSTEEEPILVSSSLKRRDNNNRHL
ncbi:Oidioi.mRNA.OKI2018_I69.chr2.g6834.t1.cds [Oikopleura dioica]|uniref:Oidioi.mRNA.OKI2018_I69.chr2.g6834.t1.cds n=1 Tax=Oikopleura dioica TaxID=34765 RepID=A0ABN7T929_OIKDI|nr:Oidioi.mRNA.OKI2018_I69.chr2.g6834.t1.cds [Oikopleura dioica]